MKKILLVMIGLLAMPLVLVAGEEKTVIAVGRAEGEPGKAGELALTRALRNAVRNGVGVDLLSETKIHNFKLEFDRVFTSSVGYIRSYRIVEQVYKKGIYTVKIKAKVGKQLPGMSNILALRMLVRRMESPRVFVQCKEQIQGVPAGAPLANNVVEKMAANIGLQLLDPETVKAAAKRQAERAGIVGDKALEQAMRAGISANSDMIIKGNVVGELGPVETPFPEMKTRTISLGYNLKAVWSDTGETIAAIHLANVSFQAKGMDPVTLPGQLTRQYMQRVLEGKKDKQLAKTNGYGLFRKIIARWITELDLGAKIRLEFRQISRKQLDRVIADLKKYQDVSYVWRREFDRQLISVLEVETRLKKHNLENLVEKALKGKFTVEQVSKRRILFAPVQ